MAIKKSELYSHLWARLRRAARQHGQQYKDYVLVMLYIKYASDKYAGRPYAPIKIPEGASFPDMVALKGSHDIDVKINEKIIGPLEPRENSLLTELPDFANENKLGSGRDGGSTDQGDRDLRESTWTSPATVPMAMTFSAMPMNT